MYTDVEKRNILKEMQQADTEINTHMPEDTHNTYGRATDACA